MLIKIMVIVGIFIKQQIFYTLGYLLNGQTQKILTAFTAGLFGSQIKRQLNGHESIDMFTWSVGNLIEESC